MTESLEENAVLTFEARTSALVASCQAAGFLTQQLVLTGGKIH